LPAESAADRNNSHAADLAVLMESCASASAFDVITAAAKFISL